EDGHAGLDGVRPIAFRTCARIAGVEDRRRASRLTRNAASRVRTRAIINKQVPVDDVVIDAVMAAKYQLAVAPGRVRKAETRGARARGGATEGATGGGCLLWPGGWSASVLVPTIDGPPAALGSKIAIGLLPVACIRPL